jgi:RNA polymerase primary sigma factor
MATKLSSTDNKVLQDLMAKAEDQGYLTLDDLMEVFPEAEENMNDLEDIFIHLSEEGVQVLYGDEKAEPEKQAASAEADVASEEPVVEEVEPELEPEMEMEAVPVANVS